MDGGVGDVGGVGGDGGLEFDIGPEVSPAPESVQPRAPFLSRRTRAGLLVAILAWALAARIGSMVGPFGAGWQHLGATFAIMARNFRLYGLGATKLLPVLNPEPAPPEEWVRFAHHPPGMGLSIAATMSVVGDGPLAVKLGGLLFSLLQVGLTYALVKRAISPLAGLVAAFVTAVLPAGAHYATHGSDLGPQAIALALLALLLDERARERDPERPRSFAVLLAAAGSLFFGWPVLVITGVIGLRDLLQRNWKRAALFLGFAPVAFALYTLQLEWATGRWTSQRGGSLLQAFLGHGLSGASAVLPEFGGTLFANRIAHHAEFLFTDFGLVLAAIGLVLLALRWRREPSCRPALLGPVLGTAALAFGYSIPFLRAVVVHRFWLIVALPWIALLLGLAADEAWRHRLGRPVALGVLVVLGFFATRADVLAQARERTPFYEELGRAIRTRTRPGELVLTTEHVNGSLDYYAERKLQGDLRDSLLADVHEAEPPLAPSWIAIAQPSFDPVDADCDELLERLPRHYAGTRIELPESGRTLHLFDLSRRPPEPASSPPASAEPVKRASSPPDGSR